MAKSNKEKAMGKIEVKYPETVKEQAKQNHRVSLYICIEQKMVDGKKTVSGTVEHDQYPAISRSSPPLKEEYHDIEKLKNIIDLKFDEIKKAFGAKK